MLYDMASKFLEAEIAPKYEEYEKAEIVERSAWEKAGAAGLLCASMPEDYGGSGGTYAHESAIAEAIGHVGTDGFRSEEHTSGLQSRENLVCRLLLEKKKKTNKNSL